MQGGVERSRSEIDSCSVTVTFSQAAAYPDIRILEYRGVTTLDAKAAASGSSATSSSGAATTTSANELIFGANIVATTTTAAGSGFTSRIITVPDGDIAEDEVVDTAGSYTATATLGSGPWIMQMVTFSACFWSGTDGKQCESEQWIDGGRHGGNYHRDELCRGRHGDFRRGSSHQRGGGEWHDDHGDDPGRQRRFHDGDRHQLRVDRAGAWPARLPMLRRQRSRVCRLIMVRPQAARR